MPQSTRDLRRAIASGLGAFITSGIVGLVVGAFLAWASGDMSALWQIALMFGGVFGFGQGLAIYFNDTRFGCWWRRKPS